MEKDALNQLELFSQVKGPGNFTKQPASSFLTYIRPYEKIILVTIGLLITSLVSFSLGIEKGKQIAVNKPNLRIELTKIKERPALQAPQPAAVKSEAPKEQKIQNYTIQLASFRSKNSADEEAMRLRKKGVSPLILSKGKYIVICAGNFSDKEVAQDLLLTLRKRYPDCFIRRL